jgi:starch synthase
MEELIRLADVSENLKFLGFVPYSEMPILHRLADVLVLPSYPTMTWQEQFGMVLAEAMASGKPVISTRSGSIPEVVEEAGLLISPGDYYALAQGIEHLMNNEDLRGQLRQWGRERSESLFCNKKMAAKLMNLLNRL